MKRSGKALGVTSLYCIFSRIFSCPVCNRSPIQMPSVYLVLCFSSDSNWNWVDEETKQAMQVEQRDDGEFWMSFKDFCRQFQEVTICTTGPDFDGDGITDEAGRVKRFLSHPYQSWCRGRIGTPARLHSCFPTGHVECIKGEWLPGYSAGGSRNNLEKFASNPQYVLSLTQPGNLALLSLSVSVSVCVCLSLSLYIMFTAQTHRCI